MPGRDGVRRFLRRSMIVRIATLSSRGRPHLTPLWFVIHAGKVYMTTRLESPAARDIGANSGVVLLFDSGARNPARVLRVRGRAVVRPELPRMILLRFALKYYLSPGGIWNHLTSLRTVGVRARYYGERAGEGGVVEVTPESSELINSPGG